MVMVEIVMWLEIALVSLVILCIFVDYLADYGEHERRAKITGAVELVLFSLLLYLFIVTAIKDPAHYKLSGITYLVMLACVFYLLMVHKNSFNNLKKLLSKHEA